MTLKVIKSIGLDSRPECKHVILRWFKDVTIGGLPSDTGWVVGFDIGAEERLWHPPVARDYGLGRSITKKQKRALVRRAANECAAVKLIHGFELVEDEVEGV